jgi:hypothetical protein
MTASPGAPSDRGRWKRVAIVVAVTLVVLAGVFWGTVQDNANAATVVSQVRQAYSGHLSHFSDINSSVMAADYAPNAEMVWTGNARNLGGSYATSSIIKEFFSNYFRVFTSVSVKNATYSVIPAGKGAEVNGSIELLGSTPAGQSMTASIVTQETYTHENGEWVISSETWYFNSFFIEPPLG